MGISDKLNQEKLEYLRLEDFLTVLQFSLTDERSSENSFDVFSNFLDKRLPVRVAEDGCIGDQLRPHNSDVKIALHKVENDLFDTDDADRKIFKRHTVTIPNWENVPVGDLLIKRSDVRDLYCDKFEQTQYPWALIKWPVSEKEWSWFQVRNLSDSAVDITSHADEQLLQVNLFSLMELLDCESPKDCWLYDDCFIDENGIRARPIKEQIEELLIGDEWSTRKQFEQDIQLDLPCSTSELQNWAERNGFNSVVSENVQLFKERRTAVAKMKAERTPVRNVEIEELLNKPIADLLVDMGLDQAEEFDRCFELYVWQRALKNESNRVNNAVYQFEESRKSDKQIILKRLSEIDCQLNGGFEISNPDPNTENQSSTSQSYPRKRHDNLTKAIIAAMADFKRKPSLEELWKFFTDDRDFTDFIVDFTDDSITWVDTKGKYHDTVKKTLANRLSKLQYPH